MTQAGEADRTRRQEFADLTLDELADVMAGPREGGPGTGTHNYHSAMAEFTRRQTLAQQAATEAQKVAATAQQAAATAAEETARYTRQNARYLLAAVIVLALSSICSLALSVLSFLLGPNSN